MLKKKFNIIKLDNLDLFDDLDSFDDSIDNSINNLIESTDFIKIKKIKIINNSNSNKFIKSTESKEVNNSNIFLNSTSNSIITTSTDEQVNLNLDIINSDDIINITELRGKEIFHYKMLDNFFNICNINQIKVMIDIINGNHLISLRFLDWFVTRYCYLYKLSINIANSYIKENNFNINISYKAQLKSFKKKNFDPFRRKKKFYYVTDSKIMLLTTIGQLNFFRWIITYDIINYTETNYKNIISKLEHVNSYFKKNSVIENMNLNKKKIKLSSDDSLIDSLDKTEIINSIYNINNKSNLEILNKKSKDIYKIPQVSRNIFLEF